MTILKYIAMSKQKADEFRAGKYDENNQPAEKTSGGSCRYCLNDICENEASLLFSYRPFEKINPYAECGPVFIHTDQCDEFNGNSVPEIITLREQVIIRGYDRNERIIEGTGKVIQADEFEDQAWQLLNQESVEYLHVRSATNNCYFCRVELVA